MTNHTNDPGSATETAAPAETLALTAEHAEILQTIQGANDALRLANLSGYWNAWKILDQLHRAGLIHSPAPFAYRYEKVSISDAGRQLLKEFMRGGPAKELENQ